WRARTLCREVLDDRDAPVGCLAGGFDRGEDAEEPERLSLVLAQCDRADGGAGGGAHGNPFRLFAKQHVSRSGYEPTPLGGACQVSWYSVYHLEGEPLLSAQAPRRAPRPDPSADHRGRDRAASDDRAGRHDRERDRRACPGWNG